MCDGEASVIVEAVRLSEGISEGDAEKADSPRQKASKSNCWTSMSVDCTGSDVVASTRCSAQEYSSIALVQFTRMTTVADCCEAADGKDPVGKVRGLIGCLIDHLGKEASDEASNVARCNEAMSETDA